MWSEKTLVMWLDKADEHGPVLARIILMVGLIPFLHAIPWAPGSPFGPR